MIAWLLFVSTICAFLWWLGGIMMHNHTPIIQEIIKMEESE